MDRLTAVGLHDLTAACAILNGQAAAAFAAFDVKYSLQLGKAALPTGRLNRASVQVQSNIAFLQLDAAAITVSVFGDRHILQQLHRGARLQLRGVKRLHNVGVLRGLAVDGDLRHCVFHGAVPAVLNGNALFRRLFQYGGRFRSQSFLLLLLLHDGAALRRVLHRLFRYSGHSFSLLLLLLLLHDGLALRHVLRRLF